MLAVGVQNLTFELLCEYWDVNINSPGLHLHKDLYIYPVQSMWVVESISNNTNYFSGSGFVFPSGKSYDWPHGDLY